MPPPPTSSRVGSALPSTVVHGDDEQNGQAAASSGAAHGHDQPQMVAPGHATPGAVAGPTGTPYASQGTATMPMPMSVPMPMYGMQPHMQPLALHAHQGGVQYQLATLPNGQQVYVPTLAPGTKRGRHESNFGGGETAAKKARPSHMDDMGAAGWGHNFPLANTGTASTRLHMQPQQPQQPQHYSRSDPSDAYCASRGEDAPPECQRPKVSYPDLITIALMETGQLRPAASAHTRTHARMHACTRRKREQWRVLLATAAVC